MFSVWLLISQNALGDVAETLDVEDLIKRKCSNGDLAGVEQLAAQFGTKEVVEGHDQYGLTCLDRASVNGDHHDLILYLLQHGANSTQKSEGGWNPLIWAAIFCRLPNVKTLLDHVEYAKEDKSEALYVGCLGEDDDKQRVMARLLLQHGADPDADLPGRERTPFMNAVFDAKIEVIREMAKWTDTAQVEKENVSPYKQDRFDDILEAIKQGQNERGLSTPAPAKAKRGVLSWRWSALRQR